MPLNPLSVTIALDALVCHSKGNDPGPRAEPYLWTIFFKVDGTVAALSDPDLTLSGTGLTVPTPGDHGDLGVSEVGAGQVVPIPAAIGRFQTTLTAIPVSPAIQKLGIPDHVAGVVGVLSVLMEQDWTSDRVAAAGHQALNAGFQQQLNQIVDGLGVLKPQPNSDDLNVAAGAIRQAISAAVRRRGGFLQDVLNLVNADDFLGFEPSVFSQGDLAATPLQQFSQRFITAKDGDWEIRGHVAATPVAASQRPALTQR